MTALSNTMISALRSSKASSIGVMACTTRTGKALESRGLASPYYHLATDTIPHYQISAAGRQHLARIERTEAELAAKRAEVIALTPVTETTAADQVRCGDLKLENERGWAVRYDVNYTGNGHATFAIIRAVNPIPGTLPTLEVQFRGSAGTVERFAHSLFDGWRWIAATA